MTKPVKKILGLSIGIVVFVVNLFASSLAGISVYVLFWWELVGLVVAVGLFAASKLALKKVRK